MKQLIMLLTHQMAKKMNPWTEDFQKKLKFYREKNPILQNNKE